MKLPPLLLRRLRRAIKRQRSTAMYPTGSHPYAAKSGRCDELPPPRNPLRAVFLILLFIVLALFAVGMTSCATSKVTTVSPDGTVTTTEESKPAIKDNTKEFIADVVWAWSPRQRPVHPKVESAK